MRIVVNHLTRMQIGFICAAGLQDGGSHVRPTLSGTRLASTLLTRNGGPFAIGAIVDLGDVTHVGTTPEIEDHDFEASATTRVDRLSGTELWAMLEAAARPSLEQIFGQDLSYPTARGAAIVEGEGNCSLGCLAPRDQPAVRVDGNRVRLRLRDGDRQLDLSVTDQRLFDESANGWLPNVERVERCELKLRLGEQLILGVGLARAWQAPWDDRRRHWLQVNNLSFESDPLGDRWAPGEG